MPADSSNDDLPVIPPLPTSSKKAPADPNPPVAKCGECGIVLHKAMHFCCQNPKCPVKPGVTFEGKGSLIRSY